jgi:RNA polymerase sigma factor (sigma-70 family)
VPGITISAVPLPIPSDIPVASIVELAANDDATGVYALYAMVSKVAGPVIHRQAGAQNADDYLHDIFLVVLQAAQRGGLREPERLPGFIRTVAQRTACRHIDRSIRSRSRLVSEEVYAMLLDHNPNPEELAIEAERAQIAKGIFASMEAREQDVLERFYNFGEHPDKICADLGLTANQFRNIKSRAKLRFTMSVKQKLQPTVPEVA